MRENIDIFPDIDFLPQMNTLRITWLRVATTLTLLCNSGKLDVNSGGDLEVGEQVLNYLSSRIRELDQYILDEAKEKEIEGLIILT